ncbi:MAG TPA: TetR family transcriptional regulator [Burkholderiales bacterium]|nr:TetR family transcriptional regulator [Burkholderiales bacterium]
MARRTKEEAAETRVRIIDTAEKIFHKKGVSRTSLEDIADAAGVTRGAIYWHFKNKAQLFEAMTERMSLPMEEMVERIGGATVDNPLDAVRACALGVLQRVATDPQTRRISEICNYKVEYVDEMAQLRTRYVECRTECLQKIEQGFRRAKKLGLIGASINPRLAAVGLHALVDGLIVNWLLDPKYLSLAKAAKPLIDTYIDGLRSGKRRH